MKTENLRIEKYASVSTTRPVKLAERNQRRWKMRIRTTNANGIYLGIDNGMVAEVSYFLPQNEELRVEKYKGEIWALSVTAAGDVFVYEESLED